MAHDVFISYAAEDKITADAVCARLEFHRIRCWIAPRDVLPGMDYGEALVEAIRQSRLVVLVFSARSNDSPHVKREVERAVAKGIPILPFRIEDVTPSASLEYFIAGSHWLDALTPPLERHLEHLAETVNLLLARTAGPQDLAEESRTPTKAPAAEVAAEQAQDARAAEERALVTSSLGLVLAKAGLRARAAVSGLGHVVERLRTSPRVLLAATVGLGGVGIAAVLLVLFVFAGQDSGADSRSESPAELSAVALTSSPSSTPTSSPTSTPVPPTNTPVPPPPPPTSTPEPAPPPPTSTPEPPPPPPPTPESPPTPVPPAVQPIGGATYLFVLGGSFQVSADGSQIVSAHSGSDLVLYCSGGPEGSPAELVTPTGGDFAPSALPVKSDGSFYYYGVVPVKVSQVMRWEWSGQFTSRETAEGYFRFWWDDTGTYPGYVFTCDSGALPWTANAQ